MHSVSLEDRYPFMVNIQSQLVSASPEQCAEHDRGERVVFKLDTYDTVVN